MPTLTGIVKNAGGTPLENCTVQLYKDGTLCGTSNKTGTDGAYSVDFATNSDYVIIVHGASGAVRCASPSPYNTVTNLSRDLVPGSEIKL